MSSEKVYGENSSYNGEMKNESLACEPLLNWSVKDKQPKNQPTNKNSSLTPQKNPKPNPTQCWNPFRKT